MPAPEPDPETANPMGSATGAENVGRGRGLAWSALAAFFLLAALAVAFVVKVKERGAKTRESALLAAVRADEAEAGKKTVAAQQLPAQTGEPAAETTAQPAAVKAPAAQKEAGEKPEKTSGAPYVSSADFAKYAARLRESALLKMEPQTVIPTTSGTLGVSGKYPWKTRIVTTVFWVGQKSGETNPAHKASAWDRDWQTSFGGVDSPNPDARRGYIPAGFIPRQNVFYAALPYNDVTGGATKPESKLVIPWFREAFVEEGKSVCRDRWLAIRNGDGKICYAQWSDCGPFRTDHWQYVFGPEKPKPNPNQGAGLNVSPAVRDYLGLGKTDVTDWKFVDAREIPNGPWAQFGDNNDFVKNARRSGQREAGAGASVREAPRVEPGGGPTIIVK